ncbi:hypothetical protein ACFCW2_08365 [Qipengyuania sp. DSG2-2]|uniref:hypothetical protein n=1 Tax=Qipengyuania sp. DGS2-2 TaxID=3349631 RepID=UPI0036D37641
MRFSLVLAAALALSACGEASSPDTSPEPAETMMPVEPDGGIGDGAEPLPDASENTEAAPKDEPEITGPDEGLLEEDARKDAAARGMGENGIPADYHGVWDYVEGTCARESDLRVAITGDTMTFYESIGKVTAVVNRPNGDRIVTLAMSGEGETWEETLKLEMDSTAMRMVISDPAGAPEPTDARKRCE